MKKSNIIITALLSLTSLSMIGCSNGGEEGSSSEHQHTFETTYTCDEHGHYFKSTCGHDVKLGYGEHIHSNAPLCQEDDICQVCHYVIREKVDCEYDENGQCIYCHNYYQVKGNTLVYDSVEITFSEEFVEYFTSGDISELNKEDYAFEAGADEFDDSWTVDEYKELLLGGPTLNILKGLVLSFQQDGVFQYMSETFHYSQEENKINFVEEAPFTVSTCNKGVKMIISIFGGEITYNLNFTESK